MAKRLPTEHRELLEKAVEVTNDAVTTLQRLNIVKEKVAAAQIDESCISKSLSARLDKVGAALEEQIAVLEDVAFA